MISLSSLSLSLSLTAIYLSLFLSSLAFHLLPFTLVFCTCVNLSPSLNFFSFSFCTLAVVFLYNQLRTYSPLSISLTFCGCPCSSFSFYKLQKTIYIIRLPYGYTIFTMKMNLFVHKTSQTNSQTVGVRNVSQI